MAEQGKVIGNVGVLDLRTATEAALAKISRISNVGMIFYSAETVGLIPLLNVANIGATKEVTHDAKFINGQHIFTKESFNATESPSLLVVNGQIIFSPEVTVEDVKQGTGPLMMNGQLIYPDHLGGILQSKLIDSNGQQISYDGEATLIIGNLTIDEIYLHSLADDTKLVITGKVTMPQIVSNELLAQKVKQIQVLGKVVFYEENGPTLLSRLETRSSKPRTTIIPTGYSWIDKPIQLNADTVEVLPGRQLYCTAKVQIEPNVTETALDASLDKLVVTDQIICPASLKQVLAKKCNLFETKAIFYQGDLWLVENETTLKAARFNYLADKATLIVYGELQIAADVEPALLAERLDKVHNFGEISGSADQIAALEARLGTDKGEFIDLQAGHEPDQGGLGNIGYLKL